MDRSDCISPIDVRYWNPTIAQFLSEEAFIRYKLQVEAALATVLHAYGFVGEDILAEITQACATVMVAEIVAEEARIKHDIRALANCIRARVSDRAKPFVHYMATSQDIIDTANVLRFRDTMTHVLLPGARELMRVLADIALREAATPQVGRTHGQHAVPITFGFAIAGYVSRLGFSVQELEWHTKNIRGKFSGAVGAHNAQALFVDPELFEFRVLGELGLDACQHSTQIAPPEPMARMLGEVVVMLGIIANLADDMRHLQRSEIGEVSEEFSEDQVGSSTMPQKQNPITFENNKSIWKIVMPRMMTVYMDQISEHQRDLTNSASMRTYGELLAYASVVLGRMTHAMGHLSVNRARMKENLSASRGSIGAEPLYLLLAFLGHPDAHEAVRKLSLRARAEGRTLMEAVAAEPCMAPYVERMTDEQKALLQNPEAYSGISEKKARDIACYWKKTLKL